MSGRMPGHILDCRAGHRTGRVLDYMPGHVPDCRTGHRVGHVPGR